MIEQIKREGLDAEDSDGSPERKADDSSDSDSEDEEEDEEALLKKFLPPPKPAPTALQLKMLKLAGQQIPDEEEVSPIFQHS